MVVHGGLDSKNVFLGDMAVLNLAKHEWKKWEPAGSSLGQIAYHAAVTVLTEREKTDKKFGIYRASKDDTVDPRIL
jgi:hypothetical protein